MGNLDAGWVVVGLIGLVLWMLAFLAQLRLFRIADTLDATLAELKLLRLLQYHDAGHISEEDFRRRAQAIIEQQRAAG